MSFPQEPQPRGWIAAVALVVMVGIVAAAAWWAWPEGSSSPPPDGVAALERARAFVGAARTVDYRVDARWQHPPLDRPDGALTQDEFTGNVKVVYPAQGTSHLDAGPYLRERIFDGDTAYSREGDSAALLAAESWRRTDLRTDRLSSRRTFLDRPDFVPKVLADSTGPRIVADAGGFTDVQVTLSGSPSLQFVQDRPFDQAQAVLTVGHDGRPQRLAISAQEPGALFAVLLFTDWDVPAQVDLPTDLDDTPDVDEVEVASYGEHPVYQPTVRAPGWVILEEGALRPDETGLSCRSIRFRYGTPDASGTGATTTTTTTTTTVPATTVPADDRPGDDRPRDDEHDGAGVAERAHRPRADRARRHLRRPAVGRGPADRRRPLPGVGDRAERPSRRRSHRRRRGHPLRLEPRPRRALAGAGVAGGQLVRVHPPRPPAPRPPPPRPGPPRPRPGRPRRHADGRAQRRRPWPKKPPLGRACTWKWSGMLRMCPSR